MELPKVKVVLFTGKTYKDGTHPIMIRITQNRKHTYKSTGFSVTPDAWDNDSQKVYEKRPSITKRQEGQLKSEKLLELKVRYQHAVVLPNATHINSEIVDQFQKILSLHKKLQINEESLDVKSIKRKLRGDYSDRKISFIMFAKEYRDRFLAAGSIGTYRRYKSVIKKLEDYRKKDLLFSEFDKEFLQNYQIHLEGKGNKLNTIHHNLRSLKAIYTCAVAEEVILGDKNPFFHIQA